MGELIERFQDLKVYKLAFELQQQIFELTKTLPKEEIYSLTNQIRKPSHSIGANSGGKCYVSEKRGKVRKEEKMKRIGRIVLGLVLLTTSLSACAIGSGKTEVSKPTLGQELMELKKAKDSGAISEQEYEELKEKLKRSHE